MNSEINIQLLPPLQHIYRTHTTYYIYHTQYRYHIHKARAHTTTSINLLLSGNYEFKR